jgi:hypothetical protein
MNRKLINLIKKTFGATYETQVSLDKIISKYSQEEIEIAYQHAESEKLSQSMREMMMARS